MSQLATTRPLSRPSAPRVSRPAARPLRIVSRPRSDRQGVFVALCLSLLIGGLVGLLMLNTAMAQGSFNLKDLQMTSNELSDIEDYLAARVDRLSAPDALARRAQSMGMVPAQTAAFLRLPDGKVLGVATPAEPVKGFKVVVGGAGQDADVEPPSTTTTKEVLAGPIRTTTVRTVALDGTVTVTITRLDTRSGVATTTTDRSGGPDSLLEGDQ